MKKKVLCTALAAVMTLSVALTGCGGAKVNTGSAGSSSSHTTTFTKGTTPSKNPTAAKNRKDTLVIGGEDPEGVFNPMYMESSYDMYVVEGLFDNLCDGDAEGQPVKTGICDNYTVSSDGLTYTFHINSKAKFTDGTPVTSEDVAFPYYVMADSSYSGPSDVSTIGIKGLMDYNAGKAKTISGIDTSKPDTIVFTLEQPNASAIYSLAASYVVPKKIYGAKYSQGNTTDVSTNYNTKPVGCGQYKFVSYKPGQEVDMVANDSYYKGTPKIKNVIYKKTDENTRIQMLQSGETDLDMVTVNAENVSQIQGAGFLDIQMFPTNGYGYIGMNLKNPMFQDQKVRQALTIGLDREKIVKTVYGKYADVINEPQSKVSWAYTDDINKYAFDTKKANQLLDEAGWKKGSDGIREKDGKKFVINFTASTPNTVNDALIPVAQENYKALGITFKAEQMDFNAVSDKVKKGDYDMYFMAWGLNVEPDASTIFKTKGSQNRTFYSNPKVDELLKKGLTTLKQEDRKKVYADLYKEINKDCPYIFMYQRRDMWVINDRVANLNASPYRDLFVDLWKAELK